MLLVKISGVVAWGNSCSARNRALIDVSCNEGLLFGLLWHGYVNKLEIIISRIVNSHSLLWTSRKRSQFYVFLFKYKITFKSSEFNLLFNSECKMEKNPLYFRYFRCTYAYLSNIKAIKTYILYISYTYISVCIYL